MARVGTLGELAALAGVSIGTVSKALSGTGHVSVSTRARIRAMADEHGFQLNRTAQSLKRGRTDAVAVVLPLGHESGQTFTDPFFITLIGYLADELALRGNDLLLSKILPDGPGWLSTIARSGKVDGVIVVGQSDQQVELERVAASYAPLVVWGQLGETQHYCSIGSDNRLGGRLAAQHLIATGRRRLAFVGNTAMPEIAARHAGFMETCAAAGLATPHHVAAHLTGEAAYQAIGVALDNGPALDGIAAASDVIAMSAVRALTERGRRIPEDVAVVGYDDVTLAAFVSPPLTTVRQDLAGAARLLVERLCQRMAGEETASLAMSPELIVRASA